MRPHLLVPDELVVGLEDVGQLVRQVVLVLRGAEHDDGRPHAEGRPLQGGKGIRTGAETGNHNPDASAKQFAKKPAT